MAALSVVINFFFIRFPLPTSTLFIGFILGTLPFIRGKFRQSLEMTHEGRRKASHVITMAIFFLIVLIPLFFKGSIGQVNLSGDFLSVLSLVGVGVIAAATLVIPGLSGTMILTAIGYYKPLLSIASTFVTALVSLNLSAALGQLIFIVPLGNRRDRRRLSFGKAGQLSVPDHTFLCICGNYRSDYRDTHRHAGGYQSRAYFRAFGSLRDCYPGSRTPVDSFSGRRRISCLFS